MSDRTSEFTIFRSNLQQMFSRELGMQMFPGLLEGPNEGTDEWRGSICWARVQEVPARVAEQQSYLIMRAWAPYTHEGSLSRRRPYDPTPLEEMADRILGAIARNQTGLGKWFQRVTAIDFDNEKQGLQATILAYSANPGV